MFKFNRKKAEQLILNSEIFDKDKYENTIIINSDEDYTKNKLIKRKIIIKTESDNFLVLPNNKKVYGNKKITYWITNKKGLKKQNFIKFKLKCKNKYNDNKSNIAILIALLSLLVTIINTIIIIIIK